MNAVFTIVAKNYIGLAQTLESSIKKYNTNIDFFIVVADEMSVAEKEEYTLPPHVLVAKECLGYDTALWQEMAFKYSLVEFCTAIKPTSFQYLFKKNKYEKIIYFDPDVFTFSSLESIYSLLDAHDIILTPHITTLQTTYSGEYADYLFLLNGTFNLGFIALKEGSVSDTMLDWWRRRLEKECFFDNDKGMATDQKWINMLPAFFGNHELCICKNIGMNMAPWNFFERQLIETNGGLYVKNRLVEGEGKPLLFVHFSGFDYKSLNQNTIQQKNSNFAQYDDLSTIFKAYIDAIQHGFFERYAKLGYSYGCYANNKTITHFNRRIYRQLIESGEKDLGNPFDTGSKFYKTLELKKLIENSLQSSDKMNNKNIQGFGTKLRWVNTFFRCVKFLLGIKRYTILLRFFRRYFKEENQVFLYNNSSTF